MKLRAVARTIAYKSGALDLFHRARHAECLTVLMFHRVLPQSEIDRSEADPLYTFTPALLAGIVLFLKQNYAIVGIQDVLASLGREKPLPACPVLMTFDDGWRDNLQWALPVLRGLPWTLFVATDAISGPELWWQEVLLWALRSKRANYEELWASAASHGEIERNVTCSHDVLGLLLRFGNLSAERRGQILAALEDRVRSLGMARHMLTETELVALQAEGVSIGSHGASHLPLSRIDDPVRDLQKSTARLSPVGGLPVMSFPHGRYDKDTVHAVRELGYSAIFTSDSVLNPCPEGWLRSDQIGRISLNAASVSDESGGLALERLAAQLYLRDVGNAAEEIA